MIAFLAARADNTEPREAAAYVHFGMTSSDLLDTALAKADTLIGTLRDHALEHRDTLRVGRTHGIHVSTLVGRHVVR